MKKLSRGLADNRGFFWLTVFVGIIFSGISVLSPTVSGEMITAFTDGAAGGIRFLILYVAVSLLQILFSLLDDYTGMTFKLLQKKTMRTNAFRAFSKKDSASREAISSFESFINNDVPTLVEQYFAGTIDIIKCVCILLFSAVSLLSVHWVLALIVFASSGLILLCPQTMRKKGGEARAAYSGAMGKYNTSLQSFLNGLRVIKCYGYYDRSNALQENANKEIEVRERALIRCQMCVQGMTSFLQVGKTLLILIVGVILISLGQMEIGGLIAVVQLAQMIAAPAEVLAYVIHARNEVLPILDQYEEITTKKESSDGEIPLFGKVESIAVKDITYEIDGLRILSGVTVTFEAGKNYLISGESGSGKSTLLRLISHTGDLNYTGSIACNGEDLQTITVDTYYRRVCPVFQEPYLFHATLEENILLGRSISRDIYISVIKKLNLEYLIDRYRGQEITAEVMEQLSGGERQRVALARAMVGKPEAYLLDEVTSALDPSTSEAIEEMLLREDAMVIHICHKPNLKLLPLYHGTFIMSAGQLSAISDAMI